MAKMERVDQDRCGLCLHCNDLDPNYPTISDLVSDLGICDFHKHIGIIIISRNSTARLTLLTFGLNDILDRMISKNETCFKFGGPRMVIKYSEPVGLDISYSALD